MTLKIFLAAGSITWLLLSLQVEKRGSDKQRNDILVSIWLMLAVIAL